jgi:hypothetical protein
LVQDATDRLLAQLPSSVAEEFRRRRRTEAPQTPADMFRIVYGWMVWAGIAEGRGGYPGLRGAPGWADYVLEQRRYLATFQALVEAFGAPDSPLVRSFQDYKERYSKTVRRMGDGYEPHVDEVAGRLVYSLPVDSGFMSTSFSFLIGDDDLAILLSDEYRRAVLKWLRMRCCNRRWGEALRA